MNPTRSETAPQSSFPSQVSRLFERFASLATSLLLVAGLVGGAATASAQAPAPPSTETPYWQTNFDEQMAQELRQQPSMRASFLQVIVRQAPRYEELQLSKTADALLYVIENDTNRRHRLMALQALSTVGPEHVGEEQYKEMMGRLYTLAEQEASPQVRKAAAGVISRYQAG